MSLRTADKGAPKRWLTTLLGSKMKETHLLKQLPTFAYVPHSYKALCPLMIECVNLIIEPVENMFFGFELFLLIYHCFYDLHDLSITDDTKTSKHSLREIKDNDESRIMEIDYYRHIHKNFMTNIQQITFYLQRGEEFLMPAINTHIVKLVRLWPVNSSGHPRGFLIDYDFLNTLNPQQRISFVEHMLAEQHHNSLFAAVEFELGEGLKVKN